MGNSHSIWIFNFFWYYKWMERVPNYGKEVTNVFVVQENSNKFTLKRKKFKEKITFGFG